MKGNQLVVTQLDSYVKSNQTLSVPGQVLNIVVRTIAFYTLKVFTEGFVHISFIAWFIKLFFF